MSTEHAASVLILNGAIVFFVGMLVGLPYGVLRARGGSEEALDNWRISHVQNLQNGMLLLIAGVCASYIDLSASLLGFMTLVLVVAAYTDMGAWIIRPLTGHTGVLPDPPAANRAVFGLFNITLLGQFVGIAILIYGAWSRWTTIAA